MALTLALALPLSLPLALALALALLLVLGEFDEHVEHGDHAVLLRPRLLAGLGLVELRLHLVDGGSHVVEGRSVADDLKTGQQLPAFFSVREPLGDLNRFVDACDAAERLGGQHVDLALRQGVVGKRALAAQHLEHVGGVVPEP